jgi:hypothetical protein
VFAAVGVGGVTGSEGAVAVAGKSFVRETGITRLRDFFFNSYWFRTEFSKLSFVLKLKIEWAD